MYWSLLGQKVQLFEPAKAKPTAAQIKKLLRAHQLVSAALVSALKENNVVSADELESVANNAQDTTDTVTDVLSRVLSLTESDLRRMDDIELGVSFQRQQNEILYVVDSAVAMLDRLRNLQHIGDSDYRILLKFWRAVPVEHQRLLDRWEKAR